MKKSEQLRELRARFDKAKSTKPVTWDSIEDQTKVLTEGYQVLEGPDSFYAWIVNVLQVSPGYALGVLRISKNRAILGNMTPQQAIDVVVGE